LIAKARGDLAEAERLFLAALSLAPENKIAAYNLGSFYWRTNRLQQAADHLEVVAMDPRLSDARLNLGNVYLAMGRDAEGWALYDERPERRTSRANALSFPEWRGEPLAGKSLFIWAEQGYGDMIFAARYFGGTGASRTTLACRPELARLFAHLPMEIIELKGDVSVPPHDFWAMPLSLPRWSTSATPPYVFGAGRPAGGVGVAWRGNPSPDPGRSLPEPLGRRLLERPGVVSLDPAASGARNFQDTADIIASVDRVVTIDTSVAHLAGAMGKPTTVLLQHRSSDWRWRIERPWYDSVTIVRQPTQGDWASALARL
jgi:Glycosyltransferase family 9 (heptosyltransferase)